MNETVVEIQNHTHMHLESSAMINVAFLSSAKKTLLKTLGQLFIQLQESTDAVKLRWATVGKEIGVSGVTCKVIVHCTGLHCANACY